MYLGIVICVGIILIYLILCKRLLCRIVDCVWCCFAACCNKCKKDAEKRKKRAEKVDQLVCEDKA